VFVLAILCNHSPSGHHIIILSSRCPAQKSPTKAMMPECGIESLWSRGAMTTAFPADFAQARSKGGLDFDAVAAAIYSQYGKAFSRLTSRSYHPEATTDALRRILKMPLSTIINKHLGYTYDNGWRYEFWLKSEKRIVYGGL